MVMFGVWMKSRGDLYHVIQYLSMFGGKYCDPVVFRQPVSANNGVSILLW
jgi:hypothetical protein